MSFAAFNAGYAIGGLSGVLVGVALAWLVRLYDAYASRSRALAVALCCCGFAGVLWLLPDAARAEPAGVVCSGLPINAGQTVTGSGAGSPCLDGPGLMTIHYASGTDVFEAWGNGSTPTCPADAWYCNWLGVSSAVTWGNGFGGGGADPDPEPEPPAAVSVADALTVAWGVVACWAVAFTARAVARAMRVGDES